MSKSLSVKRHSAAVRISHWLIALSGLVLVFSGMGEMPMYKRYNVVKLPGLGWSGDFWLQLNVHYIAASVFMAAVFFHIVYHIRRREFSIVPRHGDVKESFEIIMAMIKGKEEPPHEKFLAEQRLAWAAIGGASMVLILTGLLKAYKNMSSIVITPEALEAVTLLHTAMTMVFVLLIASHLGAFVVRANRPLLKTMFTGRVDREYARERHCKWNCDAE